MNRINLYIFIQIFKSCTLIFFIFIAISWLLQISRLFSMMNGLQVKFNTILYLSLFLIPNLINIVLPFVLIFGLTLAFLKLDKDKELIAIFSLGLSLKNILKPLILISILITFIYLILNLFLSPYIYEKYKKMEFEIRTEINLNQLNITNFLKIDKNIILDFKNNNQNFEDIFINYLKTENEQDIIFAKKGNFIKDREYINFDLFEGFKISIINEEIEKLEFEKYFIKIPNNQNYDYDNFDKNTLTIIDLIKKKKIIFIFEKIFDTLLLISIIVLFYIFLVKINNYKINRVIIFLFFIIALLINHNIIKNIQFNLNVFILMNILNIFLIYLIFFIKKIRTNE